VGSGRSRSRDSMILLFTMVLNKLLVPLYSGTRLEFPGCIYRATARDKFNRFDASFSYRKASALGLILFQPYSKIGFKSRGKLSQGIKGTLEKVFLPLCSYCGFGVKVQKIKLDKAYESKCKRTYYENSKSFR
jgi:hypothetical protein